MDLPGKLNVVNQDGDCFMCWYERKGKCVRAHADKKCSNCLRRVCDPHFMQDVKFEDSHVNVCSWCFYGGNPPPIYQLDELGCLLPPPNPNVSQYSGLPEAPPQLETAEQQQSRTQQGKGYKASLPKGRHKFVTSECAILDHEISASLHCVLHREYCVLF